jgi:hypothetical protein
VAKEMQTEDELVETQPFYRSRLLPVALDNLIEVAVAPWGGSPFEALLLDKTAALVFIVPFCAHSVIGEKLRMKREREFVRLRVRANDAIKSGNRRAMARTAARLNQALASAFDNPSDIHGMVAFAGKGACTLAEKAERAQACGAKAIIIANDNSYKPDDLGVFGEAPTNFQVRIPVVMISFNSAIRLREHHARKDGAALTFLSHRGMEGASALAKRALCIPKYECDHTTKFVHHFFHGQGGDDNDLGGGIEAELQKALGVFHIVKGAEPDSGLLIEHDEHVVYANTECTLFLFYHQRDHQWRIARKIGDLVCLLRITSHAATPDQIEAGPDWTHHEERWFIWNHAVGEWDDASDVRIRIKTDSNSTSPPTELMLELAGKGAAQGADEWLPGMLTRIRLNGTCDIRYDDGQKQQGVEPKYVRELSSNARHEGEDEGGGSGGASTTVSTKLAEGMAVEVSVQGSNRPNEPGTCGVDSPEEKTTTHFTAAVVGGHGGGILVVAEAAAAAAAVAAELKFKAEQGSRRLHMLHRGRDQHSSRMDKTYLAVFEREHDAANAFNEVVLVPAAAAASAAAAATAVTAAAVAQRVYHSMVVRQRWWGVVPVESPTNDPPNQEPSEQSLATTGPTDALRVLRNSTRPHPPSRPVPSNKLHAHHRVIRTTAGAGAGEHAADAPPLNRMGARVSAVAIARGAAAAATSVATAAKIAASEAAAVVPAAIWEDRMARQVGVHRFGHCDRLPVRRPPARPAHHPCLFPVGQVVHVFGEANQERFGIKRVKCRGLWGYWCEGTVAKREGALVDVECECLGRFLYDVVYDGGNYEANIEAGQLRRPGGMGRPTPEDGHQTGPVTEADIWEDMEERIIDGRGYEKLDEGEEVEVSYRSTGEYRRATITRCRLNGARCECDDGFSHIHHSVNLGRGRLRWVHKTKVHALVVGAAVLFFRPAPKLSQRHGLLRTKYRGVWGYWCEGRVLRKRDHSQTLSKPARRFTFDVECECDAGVGCCALMCEEGMVIHKHVPADMLEVKHLSTARDESCIKPFALGAGSFLSKVGSPQASGILETNPLNTTLEEALSNLAELRGGGIDVRACFRQAQELLSPHRHMVGCAKLITRWYEHGCPAEAVDMWQ